MERNETTKEEVLDSEKKVYSSLWKIIDNERRKNNHSEYIQDSIFNVDKFLNDNIKMNWDSEEVMLFTRNLYIANVSGFENFSIKNPLRVLSILLNNIGGYNKEENINTIIKYTENNIFKLSLENIKNSEVSSVDMLTPMRNILNILYNTKNSVTLEKKEKLKHELFDTHFERFKLENPDAVEIPPSIRNMYDKFQIDPKKYDSQLNGEETSVDNQEIITTPTISIEEAALMGKSNIKTNEEVNKTLTPFPEVKNSITELVSFFDEATDSVSDQTETIEPVMENITNTAAPFSLPQKEKTEFEIPEQQEKISGKYAKFGISELEMEEKFPDIYILGSEYEKVILQKVEHSMKDSFETAQQELMKDRKPQNKVLGFVLNNLKKGKEFFSGKKLIENFDEKTQESLKLEFFETFSKLAIEVLSYEKTRSVTTNNYHEILDNLKEKDPAFLNEIEKTRQELYKDYESIDPYYNDRFKNKKSKIVNNIKGIFGVQDEFQNKIRDNIAVKEIELVNNLRRNSKNFTTEEQSQIESALIEMITRTKEQGDYVRMMEIEMKYADKKSSSLLKSGASAGISFGAGVLRRAVMGAAGTTASAFLPFIPAVFSARFAISAFQENAKIEHERYHNMLGLNKKAAVETVEEPKEKNLSSRIFSLYPKFMNSGKEYVEDVMKENNVSVDIIIEGLQESLEDVRNSGDKSHFIQSLTKSQLHKTADVAQLLIKHKMLTFGNDDNKEEGEALGKRSTQFSQLYVLINQAKLLGNTYDFVDAEFIEKQVNDRKQYNFEFEKEEMQVGEHYVNEFKEQEAVMTQLQERVLKFKKIKREFIIQKAIKQAGVSTALFGLGTMFKPDIQEVVKKVKNFGWIHDTVPKKIIEVPQSIEVESPSTTVQDTTLSVTDYSQEDFEKIQHTGPEDAQFAEEETQRVAEKLNIPQSSVDETVVAPKIVSTKIPQEVAITVETPKEITSEKIVEIKKVENIVPKTNSIEKNPLPLDEFVKKIELPQPVDIGTGESVVMPVRIEEPQIVDIGTGESVVNVQDVETDNVIEYSPKPESAVISTRSLIQTQTPEPGISFTTESTFNKKVFLKEFLNSGMEEQPARLGEIMSAVKNGVEDGYTPEKILSHITTPDEVFGTPGVSPRLPKNIEDWNKITSKLLEDKSYTTVVGDLNPRKELYENIERMKFGSDGSNVDYLKTAKIEEVFTKNNNIGTTNYLETVIKPTDNSIFNTPQGFFSREIYERLDSVRKIAAQITGEANKFGTPQKNNMLTAVYDFEKGSTPESITQGTAKLVKSVVPSEFLVARGVDNSLKIDIEPLKGEPLKNYFVRLLRFESYMKQQQAIRINILKNPSLLVK